MIELQVVTGLIVAFVRHNLEDHKFAWDSFEQFGAEWLIHVLAIMILIAITGASILRFHRFFLGYERKGVRDEIESLIFYILMTELVASVCIFLVAHHIATDDD